VHDSLQRRAVLARPLEGVAMRNYLLLNYGNLIDDFILFYFAEYPFLTAELSVGKNMREAKLPMHVSANRLQ
jgi:hypothetical protein